MHPWTTPPTTSWPPTSSTATSATSWISNPATMTAPTRPSIPWLTPTPTSFPIHPQLIASDPAALPIHPSAPPAHAPHPPDHLFGQTSNLQTGLPPTLSTTSTTSSPTPFTAMAFSGHPPPTAPLIASTMPSPSEPHQPRPEVPDPNAASSINPPWTTAILQATDIFSPPIPSPPPPPPTDRHLNLNAPDAPPRPHRSRHPKSAPPTSSGPRHTAVKAAPKVRPDRSTDKPRRTQPPSNPPLTIAIPDSDPAPNPPAPSNQTELAVIANTTQQLQDSLRLLQAQQAQQQQLMYGAFTALNQRRLEDQLLTPSHPPATAPTPPSHSTPPPSNPPQTTPPPTTGTTNINLPSAAAPRSPVPRAPKSTSPPPRRHSRPRRKSTSRSRRRYHTSHKSPTLSHRRPRSPLLRHRSTTANPKHRRTPSPQRRRSPPRNRSPPRHRRHTSHRSPPNTVYRPREATHRSRTPSRHSRPADIVLTPAHYTSHHAGAYDADDDDTWGNWNNASHPPRPTRSTRPSSPPDRPRDMPPPEAPPGATTSRIPTGDSENSEMDDTPMSLVDFEQSDFELQEMQAAAADPTRVKCVTELDASHVVPLRHEIVGEEKEKFNRFVDEMLRRLAQPYTTSNGEQVWIRANEGTVKNIARAFGQANRLDITYAQATQGFYIEHENLLTIAVPTGLPIKPVYKNDHSATYLIYHRTGWDTVPKILVEDCVRPASWSTNEQGHPMQYPCYGFFGMSAEMRDHRHLDAHAVKQCTSQLYKIGKGQTPSGILAICRSPKSSRNQAGGNDQVQRLCKLHGISKGKDGAAAMNSNAATVAFVAGTHNLFDQLITRATPAPAPPEAAPSDVNPAHTAPDPPTSIPDSTSHEPARADSSHPRHSTPPDRDPRPEEHHRSTARSNSTWYDQSWWDDSAHTHRRYSAFDEGRPRGRHSEAGSGTHRHHETSSRSRW